MTTDGSFKKAVRRHAAATGQRYTEARDDLDGLDTRVFPATTAERIVAHLEERYGVEVASAARIGQHNEMVFRVERRDGQGSWVARAFPPARPAARVSDDAAMLAFLESHGFPAERLAVDDPVSTFDGGPVLVTQFVEPPPEPFGPGPFTTAGWLLGQLHGLPLGADGPARPGGAFGHDPAREGGPRQDLAAALTFLQTVDGKVPAEHRVRFEGLRSQIREADDCGDLPEAVVHGDIVDHVVPSANGPVAIHWQSSGRGPRLVDLALLLWTTLGDQLAVDSVLRAYRMHVELTDAELDRLPAALAVKPLYLMAWYYWQSVSTGHQPSGGEGWWSYADPAYLDAVSAATRRALGR